MESVRAKGANLTQRRQMKAITIKQPHALLIVGGIRCIESRSWNTTYRGPLLIHAAKNDDNEAWEKLAKHLNSGVADWLKPRAARGAFVGVVTLADIRQMSMTNKDEMTTFDELLAMKGENMFAWKLTKPREFTHQQLHPGSLGLWTPPRKIKMS